MAEYRYIRNGKLFQAVNVAMLADDFDGEYGADLEFQLFYTEGGLRPVTRSWEGRSESVREGGKSYLLTDDGLHVHRLLISPTATPESDARVDEALVGYLDAMLGKVAQRSGVQYRGAFKAGKAARKRLGPLVARMRAEDALERHEERRREGAR